MYHSQNDVSCLGPQLISSAPCTRLLLGWCDEKRGIMTFESMVALAL